MYIFVCIHSTVQYLFIYIYTFFVCLYLWTPTNAWDPVVSHACFFLGGAKGCSGKGRKRGAPKRVLSKARCSHDWQLVWCRHNGIPIAAFACFAITCCVACRFFPAKQWLSHIVYIYVCIWITLVFACFCSLCWFEQEKLLSTNMHVYIV